MNEPAVQGLVEAEQDPPIGGSWHVLYAAVAVNLAVLILLCYVFTKAFE